jgi:NAD(P)-dependent dehydrogenase (short-subunit alcohol dehydrogenase family)
LNHQPQTSGQGIKTLSPAIKGSIIMNISGSIALVTGANGGIGTVFVSQLLARGAAKVYIAARDTASLRQLLASGDRRLVPLPLDVTDPDQVAAAASVANDVNLLINNAGYAAFEGAISAPGLDDARREMDVNYFGTLAMTRAFGASARCRRRWRDRQHAFDALARQPAGRCDLFRIEGRRSVADP